MLKVERWKKGRGVLPTRAATFFLHRKFSLLEGWSCLLEGDVEGKQVDLLLHDSSGRRIGMEVAYSIDHEVFNARHCLKHVDRHVVVCTSKKSLEGVEKRFKECSDLVSGKVEVLVLSRALGSWIPGEE